MKKIYDTLIIGGGPAGLTAAIYSTRAGLKTGFIEKDAPGGKVVKTFTIENYPGISTINGADLSIQMLNQATENGAEYIYGNVLEVSFNNDLFELLFESKEIYYSKTVILATGTVERKIGVPGEEEYYGKGVSYCAVCDAALFKGKEVVVIGAGNSAVEEAAYLCDIVKKVHLIHRSTIFRASAHEISILKKKSNIEFHLNAVVKEFLGDNNQITGIKYTQDNKEKVLEVSAVFPYIGLDPVSDLVKKLNLANEKGEIVVDDTMATKFPGIFSAGDVNKKSLRQIATAVSDGAVAAISAKQYISRK